jgi:hypothetical protein
MQPRFNKDRLANDRAYPDLEDGELAQRARADTHQRKLCPLPPFVL